jgi:hypothetical protein
MWMVFGLIGLGSMVAVIVYNRFVTAADADPDHPFNTRGDKWVKAFLVPIVAILITVSWFFPSTALILITLFFCMMLVLAFMGKSPAEA